MKAQYHVFQNCNVIFWFSYLLLGYTLISFNQSAEFNRRQTRILSFLPYKADFMADGDQNGSGIFWNFGYLENKIRHTGLVDMCIT